MNRILEKQLHYDMDRLRADFRLMSELVFLGLSDAVEALKEGDRKKAYEVILRDSRIDSLESSIDRQCLEFLVKHVPAAAHLRFVYAAAKMVSEVERVGDYAEGIARQAIDLSYSQKHPALGAIVEMADTAFHMFSRSTQAFLDSDMDLAVETVELDRQVDSFEEEIYKRLTSENIEDSAHAKKIYSLLHIANRIERVADQSCNICEEVVYMMTGEMLKHHHEKEIRILFVCEDNACISQMAEVIANQLGAGRFAFDSAGIAAKPEWDDQCIKPLGQKGFTAEGHKPKKLDEVMPLDRYDVVVTIGDENRLRLPRLPFKTVALHWNIENPSSKQEADEKLFEQAIANLETHIKDLLNALG
ncbi:MAG: phosphate signaling complex protein PhoU [Deltaproteobacteria bacterium]|nr:phosphate signaling complex protein PhoU [Deltaproteobacteria bacterium]